MYRERERERERERGNTLPSSSSCIKFTQVNVFAKYFHKNNKCMDLLVNDKKILEKHNEIWNKIKNLFGKKIIVNPYIMKNTLKLK